MRRSVTRAQAAHRLVDAETGEARVFDRDSGVELVDAVAASCAVPLVLPPMTVAGRRYVDGGVHSVTNADPAGCDRVVVLAPVTSGIKRRQRIRHQLRTARSRCAVGNRVSGHRRAEGYPLERARSGAAGRCGDGWTRAGGGWPRPCARCGRQARRRSALPPSGAGRSPCHRYGRSTKR